MFKMFVLKDYFPAKIWPVISPDIHDNIIEKNSGAAVVFGAGFAGPQLC